MSGIYIHCLDMPTGNPEEPTAIWIYPDGSVKAFYNRGKQILNTRAVHVPDHGRLIEKGKTLDACYTHFEDYMLGKIDGKTALLNIEKEIKRAPTIIEASRKDGEA